MPYYTIDGVIYNFFLKFNALVYLTQLHNNVFWKSITVSIRWMLFSQNCVQIFRSTKCHYDYSLLLHWTALTLHWNHPEVDQTSSVLLFFGCILMFHLIHTILFKKRALNMKIHTYILAQICYNYNVNLELIPHDINMYIVKHQSYTQYYKSLNYSMPPRVSPCKIISAGRSFQVVTAKVNQLLLNLSNVLKLQGLGCSAGSQE